MRASIVLFSLALVACDGCREDKPKPTESPSSSASSAFNPFEMDPEDVPVPSDFDEEAAKITPDNVEAELVKMEKELE